MQLGCGVEAALGGLRLYGPTQPQSFIDGTVNGEQVAAFGLPIPLRLSSFPPSLWPRRTRHTSPGQALRPHRRAGPCPCPNSHAGFPVRLFQRRKHKSDPAFARITVHHGRRPAKCVPRVVKQYGPVRNPVRQRIPGPFGNLAKPPRGAATYLGKLLLFIQFREGQEGAWGICRGSPAHSVAGGDSKLSANLSNLHSGAIGICATPSGTRPRSWSNARRCSTESTRASGKAGVQTCANLSRPPRMTAIAASEQVHRSCSRAYRSCPYPLLRGCEGPGSREKSATCKS